MVKGKKEEQPISPRPAGRSQRMLVDPARLERDYASARRG
jgi:hypothetical protein